MTKEIIICRGWPGSGKSYAKDEYSLQLATKWEQRAVPWPNIFWCSADSFFGTKYKWNKEQLQDAHAYCKLHAKAAINDEADYIFIDNTNIRKDHYQFYFDLAVENKYIVKILEGQAPWRDDVEECFKRNVHGVPKDVIYRMKVQYEPDDRFEIIKL